jgi:hypothetical protein
MNTNKRQSAKRNTFDTTRDQPGSDSSSKAMHDDIWSECSTKSIDVGQASVFLYEVPGNSAKFGALISEKLQDHYIAEQFLRKHGREKIADWLKEKIPSSKRSRSGELGEILATEYVNSGHLPFQVPIHRLRWKDGRELAMRGEDLVGFQFNSKPLGFLKGEAKSRKSLSSEVIAQARGALKKNDGLPLAHTLSYITERLYEADKDKEADAIEHYVRERLPIPAQVSHLIFTFSQNDPSAFLENDAKYARRPIKHYAVGLRVTNHQSLIEEVYTKVTNG